MSTSSRRRFYALQAAFLALAMVFGMELQNLGNEAASLLTASVSSVSLQNSIRSGMKSAQMRRHSAAPSVAEITVQTHMAVTKKQSLRPRY